MNNQACHLIAAQKAGRRVWSQTLCGLMFLLLACSGVFGGEAPAWRIIAPAKTDKRLPELPPLAVVENRDNSGKTWRIEGSLSGTREVVVQDFQACFERQGWRLDKVIPLSKGGQILLLWRRGDNSILLLVHESGVAKTYFAVGLDANSSSRPGGKL